MRRRYTGELLELRRECKVVCMTADRGVKLSDNVGIIYQGIGEVVGIVYLGIGEVCILSTKTLMTWWVLSIWALVRWWVSSTRLSGW